MATQTKTAKLTVANGINVDDLFDLIDGIRREPAKGETNWRVYTTWHGHARSRSQVEGFAIGGEQVPRRFSIDIDERTPRARRIEPLRQSAGASDRGAQRLHVSRRRLASGVLQ